MKKLVIPAVLVIFLSFSSTAFAAGTGSTNAGATPDSIFYNIDKLFENIQLFLTFNTDKKADLLLKFAQERLAEAKVMAEENKPQYVQEAVKDYISEINAANDKVSEVLTDQNQSSTAKENLSQAISNATQVDTSVVNALNDSEKQQLEESKGLIVASVSAAESIDANTVKTLREEGLGFGQISQAAVLASQSGKSIEDVAALFKNGSGFGSVAKELGLTPSVVAKQLATVNISNTKAAGEVSDSNNIKSSDNQENTVKTASTENSDTEKAAPANDKTSVSQKNTSVKYTAESHDSQKPEVENENSGKSQSDSKKVENEDSNTQKATVSEDHSSSDNNQKQEVESEQENVKNPSSDSKQEVSKSDDNENDGSSLQNQTVISPDKSNATVQNDNNNKNNSEKDNGDNNGNDKQHDSGDGGDD